MTTTQPDTATPSAETDAERDALAERLFGDLLAGFELMTVQIGLDLGLYEVLAAGPATAPELARRAGIHPRYSREWAEQQAAAGFLTVATEGDADTRTYRLPAGHAEALLDPDSPAAVGAVTPALLGIGAVLDAVTAAFRSGGGVPYADYGTGIRHGIGGMNRPMFTNDLPTWVAAAPDIDARLRAGSAAVLDIGCGVGWSAITLAQTYPGITVDAVDLDEASIAEARANAEAAGVADRVTFEVRDAVTVDALGQRYDLVTVFEALHDIAHPVEVLRKVRSVVADGGALLIADERVADEFTAPADFNDRFMYGWSVLHCLPATMAESPSIAAGTVLRTPTLEAWAADAGFGGVQVLPAGNDFWKLYRLDG